MSASPENPAVATWDLHRIVRELQAARSDIEGGQTDAPRTDALPSREVLLQVVADLRSAMFPRHFGPLDLRPESIEYFVGHRLDATLCALHEQVRRGLFFRCGQLAEQRPVCEEKARGITQAFARRIPSIRVQLGTDVLAAFHGDPAATSLDEAVFCYPGITAITHHRIAHELHRLGVPLVARMIAEISHSATGIDIHPGATIGSSFFIDHGTGIVIGETCEIGERVRLYQGVTLGAKSFPLDSSGNPVKGILRHPIVENDVVIYAGATILGRVTIGAGSSIGGNVWLTRSVPAKSRITQAQAHSEYFAQGGGI